MPIPPKPTTPFTKKDKAELEHAKKSRLKGSDFRLEYYYHKYLKEWIKIIAFTDDNGNPKYISLRNL